MSTSTGNVTEVADVNEAAPPTDTELEAIRREVRPRDSLCVRAILITVGSIAAGLGILGIIVPLLPSTPFFLVAAACYGRSSTRAYTWLMTNRYFGHELRHYYLNRAATRKTKVIAIGSLWGAISFSVFIVGPPIWAIAMLAVIASAVTLHLIRLKRLVR